MPPFGDKEKYERHQCDLPNIDVSGVGRRHPWWWGVDGKVEESRYWTLLAKRPQTERSPQEWNDAIHAALMQAVKKRLTIADVPVGVLLSGGLDSSLLVALLAEAGQSDIRTKYRFMAHSYPLYNNTT